MKLADETYLGDGLYCSFESGMISLRAPREDGDHHVFLEPETYEALRKFALRIGWDLPDEDAPEC
jgi:uncharacterized protein with LGFP repeats